MSKSKAPTKVNIECIGPKKFKITWNGREKYTDQDIEYGYNTRTNKKGGKKKAGGKTFHKDLTGGANSFTFTINAKLYPDNQTKLTSVFATIKAKAKKKSASSSKKATLKISAPNQPNIGTVDTNTATTGNSTTFAWASGKDQTKKGKPQSGYQVQKLRKVGISGKGESYFKTLSGYTWSSSDDYKSFKNNDDLRVQIDETLPDNTAKSVTTIFRVRAVGTGGASGWQYLWHTYGDPAGSENVTVPEVRVDDGSRLIEVNVDYTAKTKANNPIDEIRIMYYIGVPDAGLTFPMAAFNSFTQYGDAFKPVSGTQHIKIALNSVLPLNGCMWVRIDTKHDANNYTYGDVILALIGKAAKPSGVTTGTPDETTHTIPITTITNNCTAPDSFIAVTYIDSEPNSKDSGKVVGIIPHGFTSGSVKCPDWTGKGNHGLSFKAYAGAVYKSTLRDDGVTVYSIAKYEYSATGQFDGDFCEIQIRELDQMADFNGVSDIKIFTSDDKEIDISHFDVVYSDDEDYYIAEIEKNDDYSDMTPHHAVIYYSIMMPDQSSRYMESDSLSKGVDIPAEPTNVQLKQIPTGMQVSWDNNWPSATGVEVAWADHDDALYSTNGPSTYEVLNTSRNMLNVANISAGVIWYVWVRAFVTNAEGNKTYSLWSDVAKLDLASVPDLPYLEMIPESKTVTLEDDFTLRWTYYSEDGQPQDTAKLYELTYDSNNQPVYTDFPNGTTDSEHFTITKEMMAEMGWTTDSVHQICVKVWSTSGKETEYSEPLEVTVTPKPVCAITDISMDFHRIIVGEHDYSGEIIYFDGGDDPTNLNVLAELKVTLEPITVDSAYAKYLGCKINLNETEYDIDWSERADNVYGGEFDYRTGILTSKYDSTGALLPTPVTYYLGTGDLDFVAGTNICYAVLTLGSGEGFTYNNGSITFPDSTYSNGVFTIPDSLYRNGAITPESFTIGTISMKTAEDMVEGYILDELPIKYTVTGAAGTGRTYITIERDGDYPMDRPDGSIDTGADGEIVYQFDYDTDEEQTIDSEDLMDILDDGARYIFRAWVQNSKTEQLSEPVEINFMVLWDEQAMLPDGVVEIDPEYEVAYITPILPEGGRQTDYVDIYRLSGDKPELIYYHALFGQTIVDMYPTIGKRGGYRLVYVTKNGDYIYTDPETGGKITAWLDIYDGAHLNTKFQYIDFGENQLQFKYNVKLTNAWQKSFTQTKYLGGAVQGDWDVATERTISISGNTFDDLEPEVYDILRELGDYEGICHVRTIDGSNFTADVEVTNDTSTFNSLAHQHDISLNITKVDNPVLDGIPYDRWIRENTEVE